MLQHPHLVHSRQQRHLISQQTMPHQSHLQHQTGIQLPQPMQSNFHPSQQQQQQQQLQQQSQQIQYPHQQSGSTSSDIMPVQHNHKRPIGGSYLMQQTSFSSSEEEFDGKFLIYSDFIVIFSFCLHPEKCSRIGNLSIYINKPHKINNNKKNHFHVKHTI